MKLTIYLTKVTISFLWKVHVENHKSVNSLNEMQMISKIKMIRTASCTASKQQDIFDSKQLHFFRTYFFGIILISNLRYFT